MLSATFLTFDLTRLNVTNNVCMVGVYHLRSIMASVVGGHANVLQNTSACF